MTAAPEKHNAELDRLVAERTADLSDLLGQLSTQRDEEQRLLARKMHDSLGSSMTALNMHLSLLTQQLPADQALQDRAAQMKRLLLGIIENNRQMQLTLWNDSFEFLGIKPALSELSGAFASEHGIAVRASLPDEDVHYPREQGVALLRCLEEGLSNVAAHAQATEVDVVLDDNDEAIMLTVRDNGAGPGQGMERGYGLRLLRERARRLGGELRLAAAPERGTLLTLTLPKPPAALSAA